MESGLICLSRLIADIDVAGSIFAHQYHGDAGRKAVVAFDIRGLYAVANLGDVVELNEALGKTNASAVGEKMTGGYIQFGYNLLSQVSATGSVSLTPYVRYEKVDTQATMQTGFRRSLSTNNTYTTLGLELKPISNIVLKVDHAWVGNDANSGINQFNINLGYSF